jgi:hypothetical protein
MPTEHHNAVLPRTAADFAAELQRFSGTERYYRHPFGLQYTEGVFHLAFRSEGVLYDDAHACQGAWWLLSAIAIHQPAAKKRTDGFQLWTLTVHERGPMRGAVLTCRRDSNEEPVITERIAWTDFPLTSLTLYVIDGVALLPGEY